jgi:hypothetical protein
MRKLVMRKALTITLIAVLLVSTIPAVWALQIERPDYWTPVKKVIGKGDTDGNASVSLGVFVVLFLFVAAVVEMATLVMI